MTKPPDDLMQWSKPALVKELGRLRAIMREHAERPGNDPRPASASDPIIDVAGDPNAQGGALLDARSAVLLENIDVVLIDTKSDDPVAMMLSLGGRINYADDRVTHAYIFGPDGAAALVGELSALAVRASRHEGHGQRWAAEFKAGIEARLSDAR